MSDDWGSYRLARPPRYRLPRRFLVQLMAALGLVGLVVGLHRAPAPWGASAQALVKRALAWNYPLPRVEDWARGLERKLKRDWLANGTTVPGLTLEWPATGPILSADGSQGMVIGARPGQLVRAAASGRVVAVRSFRPGQLVVLAHASGFQTSYGGLSSVMVKSGSRVRTGQVLGRVAKVGPALRPELVFRLYWRGRALDPLPRLGAY